MDKKQVAIIGAGTSGAASAALALARAGSSATLATTKLKTAIRTNPITQADLDRMEAAEIKREKRRAKRIKNMTKT